MNIVIFILLKFTGWSQYDASSRAKREKRMTAKIYENSQINNIIRFHQLRSVVFWCCLQVCALLMFKQFNLFEIAHENIGFNMIITLNLLKCLGCLTVRLANPQAKLLLKISQMSVAAWDVILRKQCMFPLTKVHELVENMWANLANANLPRLAQHFPGEAVYLGN